jgi:heme/copper-type cytochrome/quinol oxidase subunit 4
MTVVSPDATYRRSMLVRMTAAFWVLVACIAFLFLASDFRSGTALMVWYVVTIASALIFYGSLWLLARDVGRSPILWVGGAFLFGPLGIIIAFFRMRLIAA